MRHKIILFLFNILMTVSVVAVAAQDCPAIVENALSRAQRACAIMRGNQACYGYQRLEVQLQEGLSPFAFNGVGDITPVDTIESLRMSALDPALDEWGVTLFRVRADISTDLPDQNVTMLAFGAVSIEPDKSGTYLPMQAFTFTTGDEASGCTDVTENGLLIQTPEGIGRVTLWINDVRVRIGSTVLFQAQASGDMIISTFEGSAEVEAQGQTQEATAGMQVRVPMDTSMQPSGAPTAPEAFDATSTGLDSFINVTSSYTDGSVRQLIPTNVPVVNPLANNDGNNNGGGNNGGGNNSNNPPGNGGGSDDGCGNRGRGDGNCNGNGNGGGRGGRGDRDDDDDD